MNLIMVRTKLVLFSRGLFTFVAQMVQIESHLGYVEPFSLCSLAAHFEVYTNLPAVDRECVIIEAMYTATEHGGLRSRYHAYLVSNLPKKN